MAELALTDSVLNDTAKEIPEGTDVTELHRDMIKLMIISRGIGLAAPQVGISKRLIVFKQCDIPLTIINPVITRRRLGKAWSREGCLSFPGFVARVKRDKQIIVEGFDEHWKPIKMKLRGLDSAVIQHEIDHLNGVTLKNRR